MPRISSEAWASMSGAPQVFATATQRRPGADVSSGSLEPHLRMAQEPAPEGAVGLARHSAVGAHRAVSQPQDQPLTGHVVEGGANGKSVDGVHAAMNANLASAVSSAVNQSAVDALRR